MPPRLQTWRDRGGDDRITLVRSDRERGDGTGLVPAVRAVTVRLTPEEITLLRDHFLAELGLVRLARHEKALSDQETLWLKTIARIEEEAS